MAPFFGDYLNVSQVGLNVSQVGNEKTDHNIWAIVQTALFHTVKSYSQIRREELIWQSCEILMNVQRKDYLCCFSATG